MWTIEALTDPRAGARAWCSDGQPVVGGQPRGGPGTSERLMVSDLGWLDVTEIGPTAAGAPSSLAFGNTAYTFAGPVASVELTVQPDGWCIVSGDGNKFGVLLTPFPAVDRGDLALLAQMVDGGLLPYPDVPPDGRPYSDVLPTAATYFAWSPDAPTLGLSVYDWTTANFFRMQVFNYYRYTAAAGQPLSDQDIVAAIWGTNWPPYQPSDPQFMGGMMMTPATSQDDVRSQYDVISGRLRTYLDALKRVTSAAVAALPRTPTAAVPTLFSGQVDIGTLGSGALATYFQEYPGNAGPPPTPMGMDLQLALSGFLAQGRTATLKSFLSTTDSQDDAEHYSNGILLVITPAPGPTWASCAHITPLSDEATKTEYLFGPGSTFLCGPSSQQIIDGRPTTVIQLSEVANLGG